MFIISLSERREPLSLIDEGIGGDDEVLDI
jgi:hypothetical protein